MSREVLDRVTSDVLASPSIEIKSTKPSPVKSIVNNQDNEVTDVEDKSLFVKPLGQSIFAAENPSHATTLMDSHGSEVLDIEDKSLMMQPLGKSSFAAE